MKGSILDLPVISAMLLGSALVIFIVYLVLTNFFAAWPAAGASYDILEKGVEAFGMFDYMFLFFATGLSAFSIISAFFVNSKPIFFVFSVFMLALVILVSALVANVFYEFATSSTFSSVAIAFPYITLFMSNLPLFSLAVGLVVAIVMHGKPTGGRE